MWIIIGFAAAGVAVSFLQYYLLRLLSRKPQPTLYKALYIVQRLLLDVLILFLAWLAGDGALLAVAIALATGQVVFAVIHMVQTNRGDSK